MLYICDALTGDVSRFCTFLTETRTAHPWWELFPATEHPQHYSLATYIAIWLPLLHLIKWKNLMARIDVKENIFQK